MARLTNQLVIACVVCLSVVSVAAPAEAGQQKKAGQKKKAGKRRAPNPSLRQITDDPTLPRVLLIGDSISIGYTIPVRELLKDKANVHRPPANCGPTSKGLEQIDKWLGDKPWNVIHFNWGLHDLKYVGPNGKSLADPKSPGSRQQVPADQYAKNLRALVARLKKTKATLIWRSTTPVPKGANGRVVGDAAKYNAVAAGIMKENGIPTDDLFVYASSRLKKIQRPANVHFTRDGSKELAGQVVKAIEAALAPQASLKTAVLEMIRLLEKKEYQQLISQFSKPESLKKILQDSTLEKVANSFSMQKAGKLLDVLKSIKAVKPTLDPTGKIATFSLAVPIAGRNEILFEKVGRYWYVRN